jgi:uncharacterized membrane protein YgcG
MECIVAMNGHLKAGSYVITDEQSFDLGKNVNMKVDKQFVEGLELHHFFPMAPLGQLKFELKHERRTSNVIQTMESESVPAGDEIFVGPRPQKYRRQVRGDRVGSRMRRSKERESRMNDSVSTRPRSPMRSESEKPKGRSGGGGQPGKSGGSGGGRSDKSGGKSGTFRESS